MERHCDHCLYSYHTHDRESRLPIRTWRQHCGNPHYNRIHPHVPLDLEANFCRFWVPLEERRAS